MMHCSTTQNPISLERICLESVVGKIEKGDSLDGVSLPPCVMDALHTVLASRNLISDRTMHLVFHTNSEKAKLQSSQVTAEGLNHLRKCSRLTSLEIGPAIKWPSDEEYLCKVLSELCNLKELRLEQGGCVKSSLVSMLSRQNPTLTVLSLSGCSNVEDQCLSSLGQHCYRLECVDFSYTQITDDGIASLFQSPCRLTLKEVIVRGCRSITNCAIEGLYSSCPNLSILVFDHCPLVEADCRFFPRPKNLRQMAWSIFM
ncbi:protein AMN1 homolog isoform X1 [Ixodes scapularis]|uniref:protein AMN1 homolog isoform X1 n=2 Tax=Ixodes scapularis TaxID=6945 RepID=UPI001A9F8B82|nr:protein AMN1 homolog isoform X1 [Ixodes scapularis]